MSPDALDGISTRAREARAPVPILQTENLSKTFTIRQPWPAKPLRLEAVNEVGLELHEGRTLGVVGKSGCGKSTLSRLLAGTLAPTAGTIRLGGVDLSRLNRARRREALSDVQMVFQSPYTSLNPRMRVGDIVREPLDIHERHTPRGGRDSRSLAMLERVGLTAEYAARYPHELSGGQQQRVGIARALVRRSRVVICDEPVSALDVSVQAQVINLLRRLQRELGVAYVFVSHDLAVVGSIAHDIAVMYLGRVVELGAARDVLRAPRHPYTQALVDSANVPDPVIERSRTPRVLVGELPRPTHPPSGCQFRTRCWLAAEICAAERPGLECRSGFAQRVACHFA